MSEIAFLSYLMSIGKSYSTLPAIWNKFFQECNLNCRNFIENILWLSFTNDKISQKILIIRKISRLCHGSLYFGLNLNFSMKRLFHSSILLEIVLPPSILNLIFIDQWRVTIFHSSINWKKLFHSSILAATLLESV